MLLFAQKNGHMVVGYNMSALPMNDDDTLEDSIILWNHTHPRIKGLAVNPRSASSYLFNLGLKHASTYFALKW